MSGRALVRACAAGAVVVALAASSAARAADAFQVDLDLPVRYTDNALIDASRLTSWHTDPSLGASWTHPFALAPIAFAATLTLDSDRYSSVKDANARTVDGDLSFRFDTGRRADAQALQVTLGYNPSWRNGTTQGGYLLFERTLGWRADGVRLDDGDSLDDAAATLKLPLTLTRSLAPYDRDSFELKFKPEFTHTRAARTDAAGDTRAPFWNEVTVSLEVSRQWYAWREDDGRRRDYSVNPVVTFSHALTDTATLTFDIGFTRVFSTTESARYRQWDIGPTLSFVWNL